MAQLALLKSLRRLLLSGSRRLLPYAQLTLQTRHGVQFPLRCAEDLRVFSEMITAGTYHPFLDHLPLPRTILDLGCNCGYFALLLEERRRERAPESSLNKIVMVDANPDCVATSRHGVSLNQLDAHCVALHGLIGPPDAQMPFHISKSPARSSLFHAYAERRSITVPSLALTQLVAEHFPDGLDLMKVDVEGAEKYLVEHWQPVLASARSVIIEWHAFAMPWEELCVGLGQSGLRLTKSVPANGTTTALFQRA